jgi:hypothetical protein
LDLIAHLIESGRSGTIVDLHKPDERLAIAWRLARENGFDSLEQWYNASSGKSEVSIDIVNSDESSPTSEPRPLLARRIAALRRPEDAGIGDTLNRIFSKFGGSQFKWFFEAIGIDCGCDDRQSVLNAWYPYARNLPADLQSPPKSEQ